MGTSKLMIAAIAAALTVPTAAHAAGVPATTDSGGKALILVPLTLTKIHDLDFGTVIPSSVSGVVTINATTGARTLWRRRHRHDRRLRATGPNSAAPDRPTSRSSWRCRRRRS